MQINSYHASTNASLKDCHCKKPDNASFKLPKFGERQSHAGKHDAASVQGKSSVKAQLTSLQQMTTQALSSVSLAMNISSAKYGATNSSGFNGNNIGSQIQKITDTLSALISDMSEASGGGSCPSGGKLDMLNNDISKAGDKIMKEPVKMSPEIHNALVEIRNLLTELQHLMQGRGNYHSQ